MKLLTLNCHSWQEKNQIDKIKYLANVIAEEEYEVIALQEVNQLLEDKIVCSDIKSSNFAYILCQELKKIGVSYSFNWDYHHVGYDIFEEGIAFLYRGEIEEFTTDFIGECRDAKFWKTRKFSMISKKVSGEIIDFYNLHLGWWNDPDNSFQNQVEDLMKFVKGRSNKSFFMGDFNNDAGVRGEGYDYFLRKNLKDTYSSALKKDSGITVPGSIAGWEGKSSAAKRIDFIFTDSKIEIKSSKVIFNGENRDIISDHFGVSIDTL